MAPQSTRHSISTPAPRRRRGAKVAPFVRPRCEQLEDRITPALFNVQSPLSFSGLNNNGCVAVADFNHDGFEDAVLTNFGTDYAGGAGNSITVLYGKAGGGFNKLQLTTGGRNVAFATIADINGDGWADVVVVNANQQNTGSVSVFQNDGAGNLSLVGTPFSTFSNNPSWVGLADITGDGVLDVVVGSFGRDDGTGNNIVGNNVTIFQGNADAQGHGNFTYSSSPITTLAPGIQFIPTALAVADFNRDGIQDIAAVVPGVPADTGAPQPNGSIYVFQGTGSGGFGTPNQYDTGGALPLNIQAADLNGDNKPDLVVANAGDPNASPEFLNNSVGVLLNVSSNGGSVNFGFTNSLTANCHGTFAVAVADFNLDGKQDIAAVNYGGQAGAPPAFVSVYMGTGTGTFTPGSPGTYDTQTNLPGGQYLAVGDFDGNGTPDLIVAHASNLVGLLFNTSTAGQTRSLSFSGVPTSTTAGAPFSFTLTAKDLSGNTSTGYTGTVHFTSTDAAATLPADYTFTAGDAGVHTFTNSVILVTAGNRTITATDTVTSSITGASNSITVSPAAASHFTVSAPSSAVAGSAFSVTVKALDAFNNTATGYTGTVHFTKSDNGAGSSVPADYTFVAGDNGVHTFTTGVILVTAGNQTVTATDTVTSSITGTSGSIAVSAAAANHFTVSAPSSATAGNAFSVTVTALDAFANTAASYRGTVHFTKSDNGAGSSVPADYTFVAGDNGGHTFSNAVTLVTAGNQTVTATDTVSSGITGTSNSITVSAAAASHFTVSAPSSATAGSAFSVTVTALDTAGNTAASYRGTVHFTTSDSGSGVVVPADYTFVAGDNGVHTFTNGVILVTTGNQTVTATDTVTSSITGTSNTITVTAGALTHLAVGLPTSSVAGVVFTATVYALDDFGNPVPSFRSAVHFTSNDPQGVLPGDYTFTAGDAGRHNFSVTFKTAGSRSLTATDAADSLSASNSLNVTPAAASQLGASGFPSPITAGNGATLTVAAMDPFGNTATGYTGTVHFTSSDAQALLPTDYTFTVTDAGTHSFSITLVTAATQSITATDKSNGSLTGSQVGIVVKAAAANHFTLNLPSSATAGNGVSAAVTALDIFGNTATSYAGTVHFTSSDGQAVLPGNYTFQSGDNGQHSFSPVFKTAGSQTFTVTDTANGALTVSGNITVSPGAASTATLDSFPSPIAAGTSASFRVFLQDAFGNTATGYRGTMHFTSSDAQAVLPGDYTFTAVDAGLHLFSATLKTAGTDSLTATDTGNAGLSGTQSGIVVNPLASTHLGVTLTGSAFAGNPLTLTITALDPFANTAASYRGTVHVTSTDFAATLPADYTFTATDAGQHVFTGGVVFRHAGSQTLTAADTALGSINGNTTVTISPGPVTQFGVNVPTTATAGAAFSAVVSASDAFGNTATNYTGTVHFTSNDSQAVLPADYPFTIADAGQHTFSVTFKTAGNRTLTAADGAVTGSGSVTVNPSTATVFAVTGFPSPVVAGVAGGFTVAARDAFGNTATGYTGGVHLSSSDAQATVPADYSFTAGDNGSHIFTATLRTAGTQSLTVTDKIQGALTGSQAGITVNPSTAVTLLANGFPASITAGVQGRLTVTLKDAFGNVAAGYTGTVHVTSNDSQAVLPADYTFIGADAGTHNFNVTLKTAAVSSLTVTDTANAGLSGAQSGIVVTPAAATTITLTLPPSANAGNAVSAILTAFDPFGNTATGYTGTVHFTNSDVQGSVPGDYPFQPSDAGRHTFSFVFKTAGAATLTATDTANSALTASGSINVGPAAAASLTLTGLPAALDAGTSGGFTLTAKDAFGNVATGYTGTVHFTSSDTQAVLPANFTFTGPDAGLHNFTFSLKTAGTQSLGATDTANAALTSGGTLLVNPAAASGLTLAGLPASVAAGTAATFTLSAHDAFGNTATGYRGAIHFTSSDAQAVLPANYTFTSTDAGAHAFAATLKTIGSQSVTATDTASAALTASGATNVTPVAANRFTVALSGPIAEDTVLDMTVTAFDSFGNVASGYTGAVQFTSTDPLATLPANYTFTSGDAGRHTFTQAVTLRTAGTQTVSATDTTTSAVTGTSSGVTIPAEAATTGSGQTLNALDGVALSNVVVATFTHGNNSEPIGEFAATINWGDGTTSSGVISATGSGYQVQGSHTYTEEGPTQGTFSISVAVSDDAITSTLIGGSVAVKEAMPDGTRGTPNQLFVSELYTDLLGRRVDAGGLAFWSGFLDRGGARAQEIATFQTSLEYREVVVNAAYRLILHRDADIDGKVFFANTLLHGVTVEQLQAVLAGSDEYFQQHAGSTNNGYLTALYQDLFHRTLDSGGQAFFLDLLQRHVLDRTQLAGVLMSSFEYYQNIAASAYTTYLSRTADAAGRDFWAGILQHHILRDQQLVAILCATDEYFVRL